MIRGGLMHNSYGLISSVVQHLMKKYDETNPFKLCKDLGIRVKYVSMGIAADECKGFFLAQSRIRCIVINSDLSPELQKIICAHELGHAILHREKCGVSNFHDFQLFDEASEYEYEANIFAAELLLNDDEVFDILNQDLSFFQAAAELNVPAEILDFKFRVMKWKGYAMAEAPIVANSKWLGNVQDTGNRDFFD